jgi:hypothetical protein
MRNLIWTMTIAALTFSSLIPRPVQAASAAEILEAARAKSRDLEEVKQVLNGPEPNMRLATFEAMVDSGDDTMRELALDAGLTSTDAVMQALALKTVIMAQKFMTLSLEIDTSQAKEMQERSQAYLDKNGSIYTVKITATDPATGTFKMTQYQGQVSGTTVTFEVSYDKGTLFLEDETTMKGPVTIYKGGYSGFIATWKIR